jgi:hypothetical protein
MNNINKYNLICFGFMPWSNMWKRNQSMMAEIAKKKFINKVIFVNPIISIYRLFLSNRSSQSPEKIFLYSPSYIIPYKSYFYLFKKIENKLVSKISLKNITKLGLDKPYILFLNNPNVLPLDLIKNLLKCASLTIFDFSDDFLELGFGKIKIETFRSNIEAYVPAADIVIAVNEHIKKKYRFLNPNIHVIRNATNYWNFDRNDFESIDFLENIKKPGHPIIGYSGIANMSRIDERILDFIIKQRPDWKFIFIGFAKKQFLQKFLHYKNVHHIAPVDYISLPNYLQYFDVAIVPFKINAHTKGNDLLKLHDFLAMGKPVVSTEVGGAKDLKNVIRIASGSKNFLKEIEEALCGETNEDYLRRKKIAKKNSWHNRVNEFEELLKEHIEI